MNSKFKDYLLKQTNSKHCSEIETIQSLWSGYGRISRYQLDNNHNKTVVVKYIALYNSNDHPRGWNTSYSHNRKVESYKVETNWYQRWSQHCTRHCTIPNLKGTFSDGMDQWIILEDLNTNFPLRKYQLQLSEIKGCLKWLANFHITFLSMKPEGLWEIGTYWNLDTRPDEYEKIENIALKSKAHIIDNILNQCKYQTIVHGDAKLANFCFSEDGTQVAAVDFQYVGGGCGIKDFAYFLGSCLTSSECTIYQDELLDFYFSELESAFDKANHSFNFKELEEEWLKMYPIACTDFIRFMVGWMPDHQKINKYNLKIVNEVLAELY